MNYDKARELLMETFCSPCGELKFECPECGGTYCLFCEFDCNNC